MPHKNTSLIDSITYNPTSTHKCKSSMRYIVLGIGTGKGLKREVLFFGGEHNFCRKAGFIFIFCRDLSIHHREKWYHSWRCVFDAHLRLENAGSSMVGDTDRPFPRYRVSRRATIVVKLSSW